MGQSNSRLVLLGTGTPNAEPERSGPSVAVITDESAYLVDAGPGVVRRAVAARDAGIASLAPEKLSRVFLTHLHSDHTAGLPDLLLTPWVLGRDTPLEVFGPRGTAQMVQHLTEAFRADIEERTRGLEPANSTGWKSSVFEIEEGDVYADRTVQVSALAVSHGRWTAFAYRLQTSDRTVVVSGDTAPNTALEDFARNCDVLLHEVYSAKAFAEKDPEWQEYHRSVHTSSLELGKLAARVRPGMLVLYHQLYWGRSDDELLDEIRLHYKGEVRSGRDLDVL